MSCSKLNISNCCYLAAVVTLKFGTNYEANQHEKGPFFLGTNSQMMSGNIALSHKFVTQACLLAMLRFLCIYVFIFHLTSHSELKNTRNFAANVEKTYPWDVICFGGLSSG